MKAGKSRNIILYLIPWCICALLELYICNLLTFFLFSILERALWIIMLVVGTKDSNELYEGAGKTPDLVVSIVLTLFSPTLYIPIWIYMQEKWMQEEEKNRGHFYTGSIYYAMLVTWIGSAVILAVLIGLFLWESEMLFLYIGTKAAIPIVYMIIKQIPACIYIQHYNSVLAEQQINYSGAGEEIEESGHAYWDWELPDTEPVTIRDPYQPLHFMVGIQGMYEGMEFPLENDEFLMVGRDGRVAHIVIEGDTRVSRTQFQIRFHGEEHCFEIVDCSSVGTYLNGKRLEQGCIIKCKKGDKIRLGETEHEFCLE